VENKAKESRVTGPALVGLMLTVMLVLTGCGGAKVLKNPEAHIVTQELVTASDQTLSADLDWVIIRDGPGTWAKNVDWDEYLITVRNVGDESIEITNITVLDSLGTRIESRRDRKRLVKGTKETKRRYKGEGLQVKAGWGTGTLFTAGAASVAGSAAVVASAGVFSSTAGAAATGGLILLPAFAVGGVVRGVNNGRVNKQIESRQTPLPLVLQDDEDKAIHAFFPLTPSPIQIEITYFDSRGDHTLIVDTQAALEGLHLAQMEE
jgi:hypothetical protein